jgi:tetratricopeptide (TPR) repeat protein
MEMFKQLFAAMNETLDEIIGEYPNASPSERRELDGQLEALRSMSENCLEEWLRFEDRLGEVNPKEDSPKQGPMKGMTVVMPLSLMEPKTALPEACAEIFAKGQGYYKLYMFEQAIRLFKELVRKQPDFLLARVYLAMAYLRLGDHMEACRQFHFILPLTEDKKLRAITYNALGCIHVMNRNLEKACEYFKLAYSDDPDSIEPVLGVPEWPSRL